jgi:hypothetical protein
VSGLRRESVSVQLVGAVRLKLDGALRYFSIQISDKGEGDTGGQCSSRTVALW